MYGNDCLLSSCHVNQTSFHKLGYVNLLYMADNTRVELLQSDEFRICF